MKNYKIKIILEVSNNRLIYCLHYFKLQKKKKTILQYITLICFKAIGSKLMNFNHFPKSFPPNLNINFNN